MRLLEMRRQVTLRISSSTLKTHLNNLFKKIPEDLQTLIHEK
jgi:hypothetical protein